MIEGGAERDAVDDVRGRDGFAWITRGRELVGDDGEEIAEGLRVFVEVEIVESAFEEIAEQGVEVLALADAVEQVEGFANAVGGDVEGEEAFVGGSLVRHVAVAQNRSGAGLLEGGSEDEAAVVGQRLWGCSGGHGRPALVTVRS